MGLVDCKGFVQGLGRTSWQVNIHALTVYIQQGWYNILGYSMHQSLNKPKLTDESTSRSKFVLCQTRIQQSFKQPFRLLPTLLTALVYLQCLKYPIDTCSPTWFTSQKDIFGYLDLAHYMQEMPSLVMWCVCLGYCAYSFVLFFADGRITNQGVLAVAKVCQMGFSSVLFMPVIGNTLLTIRRYFIERSIGALEGAFAIISMGAFTLIITFQTFCRFDFIMKNNAMTGAIKLSNWSGVSLLLYIFINQTTNQFSEPNTITPIVIMSLSLAMHTFILIVKGQHEEETPLRIELCILAINILAIVVLLCKFLLKLELDIGMLIFLSVIAVIAISQVQFFNLVFELENVNKWSTSQIMISYAAKLRKLLLNFDDYYFNTLFLGYVEIHQQKCDNETCPLRNIGVCDDMKRMRFEDIIRKIYNDGCKLSPVNPELLLEYAIFHYEIGAKEKAMKTLLEVKEEELSLDKFYKYSRLKRLIHREISEIPDQDFLDLLSQIKVKELEEKITKKFEESALISLQFWSILNEDHPDFRKLTEIGKQKVLISQEVHKLYKEITDIAHPERITCLYIHYLNLIQNEQKLYSQVEEEIKNNEGFDDKIIIEDWANNCAPIMIVSIEEERLGSIIDLNTTCATVLGFQKFDILGRDIKSLFPGILVSQIENFMDVKQHKNTEEAFYIGYNNGYGLKLTRKIQHYSSIETGLSLIITIEQKFVPNSGFLIFGNDSRLIIMSSSCLRLLDLEETILENQNYYSDIFDVALSQINQEKTILTLSALLKDSRVQRYKQEGHLNFKNLERTFNFWKNQYDQFTVMNFNMIKSIKNASKIQQLQNTEQIMALECDFVFNIGNQEDKLTFYGGSASVPFNPVLEMSSLSLQSEIKQNETKIRNYGQNITTLRLHENYIKVIEESEHENDEQDNQSQTSTHNELITKASYIPKADEEKIFQSRQTYHNFVDKKTKKIYIIQGLVISILICVVVYIGVYFGIKDNYETIAKMYYRFALGNRVVGQIANANRIIHQTKYYSKMPNPETTQLLLQNYRDTLQSLQDLMANYTLPYPIDVYIGENIIHQFQSDEFILSLLNEFSKVRNFVTSAPSINGLELNSNSSWFVEVNGNVTKQIMYQHAHNFKANSKTRASNALKFSLIFNCCGIIMALILTVIILLLLRKINLYKIQILSVFLETTEKDIQNYSQKTENFLVTLHVDDSAQNNEAAEDLFENKKSSQAMFAKKKRFKTTHFKKLPYFLLASFFIFASGYFIHLLIFSVEKNVFLVDAIEYFDIVSKYSDVFSRNQAKIYKELNKNIDLVNSNTSATNIRLSGQINTQILEYQRQFFSLHYKTYGKIDEYHQEFAKVFMRDICNGEIKIKHACEAGPMASNGTLLMITDITIENEQIDYAKKLNPLHYITFETIKQAHLFLLKEVMNVSQQFFDEIHSNILIILLIWIAGIVLSGFAFEAFIKKFVIREIYLIKCMLKFLPVSFAKQSEGVKNFVASIIGQLK